MTNSTIPYIDLNKYDLLWLRCVDVQPQPNTYYIPAKYIFSLLREKKTQEYSLFCKSKYANGQIDGSHKISKVAIDPQKLSGDITNSALSILKQHYFITNDVEHFVPQDMDVLEFFQSTDLFNITRATPNESLFS